MTAKPIRFLRLLAAGAALMLAVTGLLAACGGDEESDQAQATQAPPLPPIITPSPTVEATEPPVDQPDLTNTPVLASDAPLYEQALERARADLAARLTIRQEEITVIPNDTPLAAQDQVACPPLTTPLPGQTATPDPALFTVSVYRLYLQYKQLIYPYQFYQPPGEGAELVVLSCQPVTDSEVLYIPTPDARAAILEQVRNDLIAQNVDPDAGDFLVRTMTWSDSALGCPAAAGETVTSEIIEGYLVRYTLNTTVYEYHADSTGERLRLCQAPGGDYASTDDLVAALRADPDLTAVERPAGEIAQYQGLTQTGEIVLLTIERWRIGVVAFDSPTAARAAAGQITDPRALHIFAAGNLLVIQEQASPEVYSILLRYAQEVRNPQAEREAAAQATAQFQAQQLASGTPVLPPEVTIPAVPSGVVGTPTIPAWLLTPPTIPPTPTMPAR